VTKPGARALGVAASGDGPRVALAGAVVRADGVVDGVALGDCERGGTDATDAVCTLAGDLDREDVRYVLVAGLALAWYNIVDLRAVHDAVDRPVLSVTFEDSPGLEPALRDAFDGTALEERLATYRAQPTRRPLEVNGETVFVRAVGCDDGTARDVVRAFTPAGGRPEPVRVARLVARAADRWT